MDIINKRLMGMFPSPDEINDTMRRDDALTVVRVVAEASRAAIDCTTQAAEKTLSVEEQIRFGIVSEQLALLAIQITEWQDGDIDKT